MLASMRFRFGGYELDLARRELLHAGRSVALEPHVFELLSYLVRARDRAVPKRELLEAVWAGTNVGEGSLQRAISLARAALQHEPAAIRT